MKLLDKFIFSFSILLGLLLLLTFFPSHKATINYASVINTKSPDRTNTLSLPEKELTYTFKVSDKLEGKGKMTVTLENKKIVGTAVGLGMSCQCNVNLNSSISGTVDEKNKQINVSITGIGDPVGILIPGKIAFSGPLKGEINNKVLELSGKVKIKGRLASYAGFKEIELLVINIPLIN